MKEAQKTNEVVLARGGVIRPHSKIKIATTPRTEKLPLTLTNYAEFQTAQQP